MACAPPTLNIRSTPALRAATSTAGFATPARSARVHMSFTGHCASEAGTASMMAVEGRGAEPAGTYKPTARMGTLKRSQITPGAISTRSGGASCAAWKRRTLSIARSMAACCSADSARSAASNSAGVTASASRRTPSNCSVSALQCGIAFATHSLDDAAGHGTHSRHLFLRGALQGCAPLGARQCVPMENSHGSPRPAFSRPAEPIRRWRPRLSSPRASPRTRSPGTRRARPPDPPVLPTV